MDRNDSGATREKIQASSHWFPGVFLENTVANRKTA
jgi:hypothetical protein